MNPIRVTKGKEYDIALMERRGGNLKTHFRLSKEIFSTVNRLSINKISALFVLILCFGISPVWGAQPAVKLYVNASAAAGGDGTSWSNAFNDLQDALAAAVSGDEIWVAEGTYKPTTSSDRSISFVLKSGVKIYGGFAGGEDRLKQRRVDPSLTVLSGDIGTIGDDTDNSFHVVYADGVTGAVLDGFTVTRGRGDANSEGAGMYTNNSALTVANCTFSNNQVAVGTTPGMAYGAGGGMYNKNSAPIVTNCTFSNNQAGNTIYNKTGRGGGMYNEGDFVTVDHDRLSPVITGCTFSNNVASSAGDPRYGGGGGMYNNNCSPTIDRCTFVRNLAGLGGGMLNYTAQPTITNCIFNTNSNTYMDGMGGAIYNVALATIINCTFYQNGWRLMPVGYPQPRFRPYTAVGGAIYDYSVASTITNCIFSENAARSDGGAVASAAFLAGDTTLTNCLFYNNKSWQGDPDPSNEVINHVHGNVDVVNALYDNPLLVDPAGGDFHLRYNSPCIDAGYSLDRGYLPSPYPTGLPATDFEGDKRIADGDGDGVPTADIGVDEFIPNLPDLQAFLQALADSGDMDGATAARLLVYVADAQAALDQNDKKKAISILNKLIADAEKSLGDTETAQLIARKTKAVIDIL